MGLGKKNQSLQIHCPVDSLEGKKGLVGAVSAGDWFADALWIINSSLPSGRGFFEYSLGKGRGIFPSLSQGGKLRH